MLKATLSVLILVGLSLSYSARSPQAALPQRIVHPESGIALVLIPAGRFQMGSPRAGIILFRISLTFVCATIIRSCK